MRWLNFESSRVQVSDVVIAQSTQVHVDYLHRYFPDIHLTKWKFGCMSVVELCLILNLLSIMLFSNKCSYASYNSKGGHY